VKERILQLFQHSPTATFSLREIMKELAIPAGERATLRRLLKSLADEGKVQAFRNHHFGACHTHGTTIGFLSVTLRGMGFVSPETTLDPGEQELADVRVSPRNMADAIHGDKVEVHIVREKLGKPEGYVVRVLERRSPTLVGRFLHQRKGGLALPRDPRIDRNILIPECPPRSVLKDDQWIVVRITQWTPWPEPLLGRIEEILGATGEPGLDVLLIVRDHGVVETFPEEVEREAEALGAVLSPKEIAARRDLRDRLLVTIDPERAKDFDDAVSLEMTDQGHYLLGVHIADVSHYVAEGSAIDREAFDRATSIYPVDRVVPMLPERLSNILCSLRPREDRPAMSAQIELDAEGRIVGYELFRSIIRSRHRLTYRQVQDLFEGAPPDRVADFADAHEMLFAMRQLAAVLQDVRRRRGSLDLDIPEPEVLLDEQLRVTALRRTERWHSHRLVEDFMILANEVVARHLTDQRLPTLYRIHESPNPEKFERLRPFFKAAGVAVPAIDGKVSLQALQHILDRLREMQAGPILHTLILRAMMRAVYSPFNVGHFGLASECYCHFTSPIRRYPDLVVHRVLAESFRHPKVSARKIEHWEETFEDIARHASAREQRADEIERDAVRVKALEYMRQYVGEDFGGTISGVASFGLFVELDPYPVEGLIHVRDLKDDYYQYDEESLTLVGESSGRRFRFGDTVAVVITRVDLINLQMDLELAEAPPPPPKRGRQPGKHRHAVKGARAAASPQRGIRRRRR